MMSRSPRRPPRPSLPALLAASLGLCLGCETIAPLDAVNHVDHGPVISGVCPDLSYDWSAPIAGPNYDDALSLVVDPGGNLLVATVVGGARFGETPVAGNSAIERYSAGGAPLWAAGFDLGTQGRLWSIGTDAFGNSIVAGTMSGYVQIGLDTFTNTGANDLLVAKFSSSGDEIWAKQYGGDASVTSLAAGTDQAGNVVVASTNTFNYGEPFPLDYGASPNCGEAPGALSLGKLGPDGVCIFNIGWDVGTGPGSVVLGIDHQSGDFAVSFTAEESVDFHDGVASAPSTLGYDAAITKFSWAGRALWTHRIGNAGGVDAYSYVESLAVLPNGNVLAAGSFGQGADVELGLGVVVSSPAPSGREPDPSDRTGFIALLSGANGELLEHRLLEGMKRAPSPGLVLAVGPGPTPTVALTGGVQSITGGDVDFGGGPVPAPEGSDPNGYGAFFVLFDSELEYCSSARWGDGTGQQGKAIAFRSDGGLAIAGFNNGSIRFAGSDTYASSGGDGFVATLKASRKQP